MSSDQPPPSRAVRRSVVKIHRWLSIGAAIFWLVQALTGSLLGFHFELEDIAITTAKRPTDLAAIEEKMDSLGAAGPNAEVHWIWTTAGLPDRYIILFDDAEGVTRKMYIDGGGDTLRNQAANDYSFLGLMREIHMTLLSGAVGHWILAITGILLISNLILGLIAAWPRKGMWRNALTLNGKGNATARLSSWHRAVGLWAALPALLIIATGTLILFEHEIGDVLDAEDVTLPANSPAGASVGFAAAAQAAVEAIPGSRFVGTTLPSKEDASYYAWVRAPGELYRGGYGGSLVIVDANDGSVRGAYPLTEAKAGLVFVKSLYPIHTGEFAGAPGRIAAMLIGVWLAAMIGLGMLLWLKRRARSKPTPAVGMKTPATSKV